jgi:hypothetical protein
MAPTTNPTHNATERAPRFRCCATCSQAVRPMGKLLGCATGAAAVRIYDACARFQPAVTASPESEGR